MGKRALIIGVSGQDGSLLARFLLGKGYKVSGTSRDAQISSFHNLVRLKIRKEVEVESLSLNDFRSVLSVLKKARPDEIYNLAGQSSVGLSFDQPVETFESNGIGALNLLESIRFLDLPIKLYSASSSECFGDTQGNAANEGTPFHPRSPYAVAKAAAFWQVANYREAYGIFACSGLLFNHESPLRPNRFVTQKIVKSACLISTGRTEKLRLGNLNVSRDWGWAPEYVIAMWLMLQQERPDDFVIATGQTNLLETFLQTVFSYLNLEWRDHVLFHPNLLRPSEILVSKADPNKARNLLGWNPRHRMADVARMMIQAEQGSDFVMEFE